MDSIVDILRELPNKAAALWVNHRRSIGVTASGIAVVAAICSYRAIKRRRRRVSLVDKLGGTTGRIPYLGFVPKSSEQFLYGLEVLADTYGDAFAIRIMGNEAVILADSQSVREVLRERPHNLMRSFNKDKLLPIYGVLTSEGKEWRRNRRLAAPALDYKSTAQTVPAMAVVGKRLVRQLQGLACDGRIVWEPTRWFMMCSLDILCLTAYGMDFYFLNPDGITLPSGTKVIAESIFNFIDGAIYVLDFSALCPSITRNHFPWNLNPTIRKFYASIQRLNDLADDLAEQRRAEGDQSRRNDLLSKLLHLGKHELEGNFVTFFFAGSETTSATLAWCLYYFCLYPDVQARARAEVDTLGRDPETDDDLERLPFVESCIFEALRLQPPIPLLIHETTAEMSVRGHTIPIGTWIVTLTRKQMRSDAEGGTCYSPERWLSSDGCFDRARAQERSLAFGAGPRRCPGSNLAMREAILILAMILRHFDNFKHTSSISSVEMKTTLSFQPANFEVSMSKRQNSEGTFV
ncbi:cytochrome p450, putative [Perkinsus marinus ATCC 50983]|uniref:Cytochrome p450, putative n=1 Tax=Perkinsus marinus (strain ATCC 50983 / TXsc) TaxID=423536 RepID=C5LU19_PERM5|nr:cytochrome p450, putative [Perkinsus marinus ATCC 50983]XP_002767101.1 cytochrome p450, putative [Perkinsus marinus ATCC 50983]EEQ99817.1 cytochrome p450, putative [Perkinsus marinus ATCC 50983]EEQ99818.1 cytochrome p450, putative [Perkinsus marinus ATCC 50983]|eukprot:XP_002767100.1 cytochrome p450, putative [Perkinsus marinus ATCC 50983]